MDRCLSRAGRVMLCVCKREFYSIVSLIYFLPFPLFLLLQFKSYLVHILEDYKADEGMKQRSSFSAELNSVKEYKKKIEGRYAVMETRATELAKTNLSFLSRV